MNINFVSLGNDTLATHRWRVKLPAYGLEQEGHSCTITRHGDPKADINIFQKHFDPIGAEGFVLNHKTKTIFDISDDHFDREAGGHYTLMCQECDVITCPNDRMQERIYDATGRLARIIPDPISFPEGEFRYSRDPKILWFGNAVNITSIYPILSSVPNLTVVSNIQSLELPDHVQFIPWSVGLVEDIIDEFDIVIIPRNEYKWAKYKSPNRAVDALNAGKFVITDFDEVYGDLEEFVYLGDVKDGLEFYRDNPDTVRRMVESGQEHVQEVFSPESVLEAWKIAIESDKEV